MTTKLFLLKFNDKNLESVSYVTETVSNGNGNDVKMKDPLYRPIKFN